MHGTAVQGFRALEGVAHTASGQDRPYGLSRNSETLTRKS